MKSFFYFDIQNVNGDTERHIIEKLDNGFRSFPLSSESQYIDSLNQWIDEGNELMEWNPNQAAEESVSDEPSPEQVVDDAN